MGTVISLDIADMSIDWSKNARGADHGALFQAVDRQQIHSDQIDHNSVEEDDPEFPTMEMGFSRRLIDVLPRLNLLGFSHDGIEREYMQAAAACVEERRFLNEEGFEQSLDVMSFSEFHDFVAQYPIADLDAKFLFDGSEEGDHRVMGRFTDELVKERVPHYSSYDRDGYSERSYFGGLIGFLHPYSILKLLAKNEQNLEAPLVWRYGPLVQNGWAKDAEFVPDAPRTQTFLIVTEGSSDTHVLRHAFALLRPEVADFFRFIDVSKGHPFSGAGNLIRFAEGLAKIDVHNQVLFLLDNDVEGVRAFRRIRGLDLPANMRATTLPELRDFEEFRTRGPEGVKAANINGRGAAIECYLDLEASKLPPAEVVWTSYNKDVDAYQGELKQKEAFTKAFLKQTQASIAQGSYNVSRLTRLLDLIFDECSAIAAEFQTV